MLFPYKYVPHQMEKMQEFIDFIFFEVWCKALWEEYDISLFNSCPELKTMIEGLYHTEPKGADFFIKGIQQIFDQFKVLNYFDLMRMQRWYEANNNIEAACSRKGKVNPVRYGSLGKSFNERYQGLSKSLHAFFKDLYSPNFLTLKIIENAIGNIDDHYQHFVQVNTAGKCPFCGIGDVKGVHHTKREAYDHYLPKALYPFSSINFRNLAPACHECNSTYKLSKDPVNTAAGRRKAFYPYADPGSNIEVTIELSKPDVDDLTPADIQLAFGPSELNEEIETWKDVYGIEERYRGKLLEGDGKAWLTEILDEWKWKEVSNGNEGRSPAEYLRALNRHVTNSPFTGANFLKKAFLEACERQKLFG
ncbi:MAG: hypothetical protein HY272_03715 [Gammaproteobacteria bacterium]|nr:hypothetical protein [Gammaproteobacteria bacterium]